MVEKLTFERFMVKILRGLFQKFQLISSNF